MTIVLDEVSRNTETGLIHTQVRYIGLVQPLVTRGWSLVTCVPASGPHLTDTRSVARPPPAARCLRSLLTDSCSDCPQQSPCLVAGNQLQHHTPLLQTTQQLHAVADVI